MKIGDRVRLKESPEIHAIILSTNYSISRPYQIKYLQGKGIDVCYNSELELVTDSNDILKEML